jgi:putative ABC transport system permease protein
MRWTKRWTRRLRALVRKDAVERELDEELAFHLEMETEKNLRAGMSPAEARRRAALAFGAVERFKEEVRDARAFGWVTGLSLDLRLGARMLVKYPGLALVGGVGMAAAIAIGAAFAVLVSAMYSPLPLDEGERVVTLESWDAEINNQEPRILHDFAAWKGELRTVEELGAFRTLERNLSAPGLSAEPVIVAEMTASGFRVARTPPLLGRYLVDDDERPGTPPVVVIGHDEWRGRFAGDPGVVGREVRLGSAVHTIVGVMPEGFAFPLNHRFWVPLRADPAAYARREGPAINVFGRLAPGATLERANAELATAGRRAAAAFPETHARLRPRAVPFTMHLFDDLQGTEVPLTNLLVLLLLGVVCANVAILVYARTATRRGEITVRSALGASRRRIVTQLFVEALVLAAVAGAVALALVGFALGHVDALVEPLPAVPFWMDFRLTPAVVLYVVGLTVLGAAVAGIIPALKATGAGLERSLRQLGGGTGMRLGRTWAVLIIAQVAFAVAVMPAAVHHASQWIRRGTGGPGFAADEFLTTRLGMDREVPPSAEAEGYERAFDARYVARAAELARRLEAEPGVSALTFAMELPGQEPTMRVDVEGVPAPARAPSGHPVRFNRVDAGFFGAFGVPVLAGRRFHSGDLVDGAAPAVVNRTFVREVLGGGEALGRRFRYLEGYRSGGVVRPPAGVELGRWYEVVGVVGDFPARPMDPGETEARLYHPLAPGQAYPLNLAVRVRDAAPAEFSGRLRAVAAGLDPTLRLNGLRPLDAVLRQWQTGMRMAALAVGLVTLSVLLLSAAGLYALMSFTVTRRRREIGIRAAMGADPRQLLRSIFSRALGQMALGVVAGLAAAGLLDVAAGGAMMGGDGLVLLPAVAALMLGVGLLAAVGPARRGLRIHPMEALREE